MTQQKLETFTVDRAIAVINTAKHHNLYPHAIPEDDQKKIEEAEKLYKMAEQVKVIADTSGKDKIGHYDAAMAVIAQAEVFGGANGDFIPPGPEAQAAEAAVAQAVEPPIATDPTVATSDIPAPAQTVNALIGGTQKAWSLEEAATQIRAGASFQVIDAPSLQLLRDKMGISDLPSHGKLLGHIPEDQQVAVTVDSIDDVWSWDQLVDWVVDKGNTNVVVNDEDRAAKLNEMIIAKANSPQPGEPPAQPGPVAQQIAATQEVQSRVPDTSSTNPVGTPQKDEHWVDTSGNVYKINIAGGTAGEVQHLKADGSYDNPFVLPWSMFTRRAETHEIGGAPSAPQPESSASPSAGSPVSTSSGTPVAASSPTPPVTTSTPSSSTTPQPAPSPSSPVPSEPLASGSSLPDQGAPPSTPIAPPQPPPASPSPPTETPAPASVPSPTPPPAPAVPTPPPSVPSSAVASSPSESPGSGEPRKDPALDDDEGNEQYSKIIDKAYDKLQQRAGTPLPGEPLEPPQMPDDPTAVDSLTNRRLHLAFNACAAWVHRLIGIHNQVSIDCGRYRDSIYRAHRDEARAEIGKQATVTEQNDWIILKNFDDVQSWIRRQEHHADQERSLRVLYSIYTENVSVLSRDYSMQSKDEAGSR